MPQLMEPRRPPADDSPRLVGALSTPEEYRPFGNMESRNGLQERVEIPLMIRALRLPTGGRLLEVGCGRGVALPVLAARLRPSALVGIDVDASLVSRARHRVVRAGLRASVHVADVRDLPFDDGSFDMVIDFGTCYHVSGGTSGRRQALAEIARVLRLGGLFVHETPVAQHLAHPVRSFGRKLPWETVRELVTERSAVLWTVRKRVNGER